jgi:hypothetical protein
MSQRQRTSAFYRAQEAGGLAAWGGRPHTANPYKPGGSWSLHGEWVSGWQATQARLAHQMTRGEYRCPRCNAVYTSPWLAIQCYA